MGTSEEKKNEAKDQICHLFPMEEKWTHGILTTKTDLSFIPSLEKTGACFSCVLSRS